MRLLLTNDDGIDAPGLAALAEAAAEFGEITIVAPRDALSGCSHQVSAHRPLHVATRGANRYAVDGTPADCVRVGLLHLAADADWVLSGVNDGGNLGVDVFMSGTVAAVREAAWMGKPGIAVSQYRDRRGERRRSDWTSTVADTRRVLERLLDRPPRKGGFWNVNFPDVEPHAAPAEIVDAPLEHGHLPVQFELDGDLYRYTGSYRDRSRAEGTDVDVCFSGRIAVTQVLPPESG